MGYSKELSNNIIELKNRININDKSTSYTSTTNTTFGGAINNNKYINKRNIYNRNLNLNRNRNNQRVLQKIIYIPDYRKKMYNKAISPTKFDQLSKLAFYTNIELELFQGKSITDEQKNSVKCHNTFQRIREAWADIFGFKFKPSTIPQTQINKTTKNNAEKNNKINNSRNKTIKRFPKINQKEREQKQKEREQKQKEQEQKQKEREQKQKEQEQRQKEQEQKQKELEQKQKELEERQKEIEEQKQKQLQPQNIQPNKI
jgi:hypothetical protein